MGAIFVLGKVGRVREGKSDVFMIERSMSEGLCEAGICRWWERLIG